MLDSSKLCWPSGDAPSHMPILQMVAANGWFPWNTDDSSCQNPDYSNLRLVSKDMKSHMDNPTNGGPDFDYIVYSSIVRTAGTTMASVTIVSLI